jgi:predicted nucleic acid-binding protein
VEPSLSGGIGIDEVSDYADTSFLISLYTPDANSLTARTSLRPRDTLLLTPFGEFEFLNAIELRVFRREIEATEAEGSLRIFQDDIAAGFLLRRPVPAMAYERAMILAKAHSRQLGARGMDILHVTIAIELAAGTFFTFDRVQRRLARVAGLAVRPVR